MKGGHFKRLRTAGQRRVVGVSVRAGMLMVVPPGVAMVQVQPHLPTQTVPRLVDGSKFNYSQRRSLLVATPYRSRGVWRKLTPDGRFVCVTHCGRKVPPANAHWAFVPEGVDDLLGWVRQWMAWRQRVILAQTAIKAAIRRSLARTARWMRERDAMPVRHRSGGVFVGGE